MAAEKKKPAPVMNEKQAQRKAKQDEQRQLRTAQKEAQRQRQAEQNAAKQEAKAFAKARLAERQTDKDDAYVLRKNTVFHVLRVLLWLALAFVFLKGVMVSIRPDPVVEVNEAITAFKADFSGYQEQDNEVLAFAQSFAVNYMTYAAGAEQDYTNRLGRYAAPAVTNAGYKFAAGSGAAVTYAQAYRKEAYSPTQTDVWVLLTVEYRSRTQSADGTITEQTISETATLKVPVAMQDNLYIVEDFPVFVNDSNKQSEYTATTFRGGGECDRTTGEAVALALSNFFTAYYESEQSVINYYLSPGANQADFVGLNGRVSFDKLSNIRVYYADESKTNHFVAVLTVQVTDKNGVKMSQNFHVQLIFRDSQYYVQSMDTRTYNLNLEDKS